MSITSAKTVGKSKFVYIFTKKEKVSSGRGLLKLATFKCDT